MRKRGLRPYLPLRAQVMFRRKSVGFRSICLLLAVLLTIPFLPNMVYAQASRRTTFLPKRGRPKKPRHPDVRQMPRNPIYGDGDERMTDSPPGQDKAPPRQTPSNSCTPYMVEMWEEMVEMRSESLEFEFTFINNDIGRTVTPMTEKAINGWPTRKAERAFTEINNYVKGTEGDLAFMLRFDDCLNQECNLKKFVAREFPEKNKLAKGTNRLYYWTKETVSLETEGALERVSEARKFLAHYTSLFEKVTKRNITESGECLPDSMEAESDHEPEPPSVKSATQEYESVKIEAEVEVEESYEPGPKRAQHASSAPPASGGDGASWLLWGGLGVAAVAGGAYAIAQSQKKDEVRQCHCGVVADGSISNVAYCAADGVCCATNVQYFCPSTGKCQPLIGAPACPGGRYQCGPPCVD